MAEKNSSYKLDFKFRLQDNMRQWTMTDFRNCRYSWYDNTDSFVSPVLNEIRDNFYADKFPADQYYVSYYSSNGNPKILEMKNFLYQAPEWQKCEAAFQKWLKRRSGVLNSWNQFVEQYNKDNTSKEVSTEPLTLKLLTEYCHKTSFRNILENARPIKIQVGSVVKLSDKYKSSSSYDPYYWDYDNRSLERIGTVLRYTGDCSTQKCGTGSREVHVMWFGSGKETKIAEKSLEIYNQPVVVSEVNQEEVVNQ